jgi:hypothetical protein
LNYLALELGAKYRSIISAFNLFVSEAFVHSAWGFYLTAARNMWLEEFIVRMTGSDIYMYSVIGLVSRRRFGGLYLLLSCEIMIAGSYDRWIPDIRGSPEAESGLSYHFSIFLNNRT